MLPLDAADASRDRLRAIDLELCRASLALEDLTVSRRGGRRGPVVHELERIDVAGLATEAVGAAQGAARAAGTTVTLSEATAGRALGRPAPPATVWGDRVRLAQALGNLIANAIEHGGPEVALRVHAGRGARAARPAPGVPAPSHTLRPAPPAHA